MATSPAIAMTQAAQELGPAMERLAEQARTDPVVFCQFVLRDESNGYPVELQQMHVEWLDLLTAHKRVVIWSHTEAAKTSIISIGRVLFEIGNNPNIRVLIVSSSSGLAKKIVKALKVYIEQSPEFRMVFPHVQPDKRDGIGSWKEDSFHVTRSVRSKDPTVQAVGFEGQVLGSRTDLVVVDDYLTPESTYSDLMREKGYRWLKSTIEGRKTARAPLWFVGNVWHADDAMHRYAKEPATVSAKYPVRNAAGESSWPAVWPQERIEEEIENRGPIESRRSLFCDPVSDADRRFKEAYVVRALQNGDGFELAWALHSIPAGFRSITGLDVAVSKKDAADETAAVTIAVNEKNQERQILDVYGGKLSGPEIVNLVLDVHRRYQSIVYVESNAAQAYIKQFVDKDHAIPVKAFHTGKNKIDPAFGFESLAIELSSGKWAIPNRGGITTGHMDGEVRKLINELLRYDPRSHTGDRAMAMWIAREGARLQANPAGVGKRGRRT